MRRIRLWLPLAVALAVVACGDAGTGVDDPQSFVIDPPQASISIGEAVQLSARLQDGSPAPNVTWTSSDLGVATVSGSGLVSGLSLGGPVTITATAGASTARAEITVTAGPPSQLAIDTQPDGAGASGVALNRQPVVRVLDADGNPVQQQGVVVTASVVQGPGSVSGAASVTTDELGLASFTDLSISGGTGAYRLRFEAEGLDPATSDTIDLGPGPVATLSFGVSPPANVQSGVAFSTQPRILVRDAADNPVAGVVVTASMGTGTAVIGGATSAVSDDTGAAAFMDLSVEGVVGDVTLLFTAGSVTVESGIVSISAGPAAVLSLATQPSATAQSGIPFDRQPVVLVTDDAGNPVQGANVSVSIETGGGTLEGGLVVTSSPDGLATYSDLSILGAAGVRTLRFDSDQASVVSDPIDLTVGTPSALTVQTQPSSVAQAGVPFAEQPAVMVTDDGGNPVPGADVSVSIASGAGTLAGVSTVVTDNLGVATFTDLQIDGAVGERTLRFAAGAAETVSGAIQVGPGPVASLTIAQQPSSTVPNDVPFSQQPAVRAADSFGNGVAGVTVTAEIQSGSPALGGALTTTTDISGVASFADLTITGTVGIRTLRFFDGGIDAVSTSIDVVPGAPASVAIVTQPPAISLDEQTFTQSPQADVRDVSDNLVPGVSVQATIGSGGGTLNGTSTVTTNASGRATFSTLSIDGSPGERTLRFTASAAESTSDPVHVALKAGTFIDLQYCGSDPLQRLDVYVPANSFPRPRPVVAYVHGGGWIGRDKGDTDLVLWTNERDELLSRGYVVTTLNYRLAKSGQPSTQWPAAMHDLKCAVRHLRAQGIDYGADGTRIGVWGGSAGGHLAAMLGTTAGNLEGNLGFAGTSSAVQAVITIGGISDMTTDAAIAELFFSGGEIMFEATWPGPSAQMTEASPVNWASADDAPFIIVHGQEDTTVDPNQAERLNTALGSAGASVTIERVANGGHNLEDVGGAATPSIASLVQTIANFFDTHVGSGF